MKALGKFISSLIIIDTFLVSYAVGFNSRHVLVIDPTLPPVEAKPAEKAVQKPVEKPAEVKEQQTAKPAKVEPAAEGKKPKHRAKPKSGGQAKSGHSD